MSVKRYNIAKPENYTKDGEEKTKWNTVGTLVIITREDDGKVSRIVEIPAIGLKANAFPIEEKSEDSKQKTQPEDDGVDPEDVPFN